MTTNSSDNDRPAELHPETAAMLDRFFEALRAKMLEAQKKYGFKDDWRTDHWEVECQSELRRHVQKGDPLDVAAYAAICHARGWKTTSRPVVALAPESVAADPAIEAFEVGDRDLVIEGLQTQIDVAAGLPGDAKCVGMDSSRADAPGSLLWMAGAIPLFEQIARTLDSEAFPAGVVVSAEFDRARRHRAMVAGTRIGDMLARLDPNALLHCLANLRAGKGAQT